MECVIDMKKPGKKSFLGLSSGMGIDQDGIKNQPAKLAALLLIIDPTW
jgi:hypothetical protein